MPTIVCNQIEKGDTSSTSSIFFQNTVAESISSLDRPTNGIVWNVYVSQISSLKKFFLQRFEHLNCIKTTCSALEAINDYDSKSTRPPRSGDFGAARYVDGSWYRAKVTKNIDSGLHVCFVDFGDDEEIVTEFKFLPKRLVDAKPMAYCCYLKNLPKGTETELSYSNLSILRQFFGANEVTATFLNATEPYEVVLALKNGKDILETINELVWEGVIPAVNCDQVHEAKQKMLNKIVSFGHDDRRGEAVVCVGPFKTINNFYIETKSCNTIARQIRSEIDSVRKNIPVLRPEVGQILIGKCEKFKKLYRVRLVWKYPDSEVFNCFLIDRGIFEDCSKFFKPNTFILSAPPVKIHCSLPVSKHYTENMAKYINHCFVDELKLSREDRKTLKPIKIGSPCVIDLNIKGLNMSEIIMPCNVKVTDINRPFNRLRAFTARVVCPESLKIADALRWTKKFQTVQDPQTLQLYVANFEERYIRVKLVGITKKYEVIAVDDKKISFFVDVLYKLPKSIANAKTTDLYCTLVLDSDDLVDRCSEKKFIEICDGGKTTFCMVVVKNNHVNGHYVKLFLKSIDVSTMIAA